MQRPTQQLTLTNDTPAHDISPPQTSQAADYIHNFSNIPWNDSDEPDPTQPTKLYYLLTITGLLLIAPYPHNNHCLGEHYLAWAPLTSEPTLTLH